MPTYQLELPSRKPNRLPGVDYSLNGAYFLTICTTKRHELLGRITQKEMILSENGISADSCIRDIQKAYPSVWLDSYTIMPNHVHLLLVLLDASRNPSASTLIQQLKTAITQKAGFPFWQKSFHDNIVRTADEYSTIRTYNIH